MGHKYDPDYAVHPGETVKECVAMYELTPIEIATAFGNTQTETRKTEAMHDEILEICCGYRNIEQKHALAFSLSFRTSVQFWLNRQKHYDEHMDKIHCRRMNAIRRDSTGKR